MSKKTCAQCGKEIEGNGLQWKILCRSDVQTAQRLGWRITFRARNGVTCNVEKMVTVCSEECGEHHQWAHEG